LKTVDAGNVTVAPARLYGVAADQIEAGKIKAAVRITHIWAHNISENIRLPSAGRARASPPQHFQIEIRFRTVIPLNGELVSDLLNILWLKAHISTLTGCLSSKQSLNRAL
jgi:hypothetical protein